MHRNRTTLRPLQRNIRLQFANLQISNLFLTSFSLNLQSLSAATGSFAYTATSKGSQFLTNISDLPGNESQCPRPWGAHHQTQDSAQQPRASKKLSQTSSHPPPNRHQIANWRDLITDFAAMRGGALENAAGLDSSAAWM